ncbi:hypothetical protein Mh1964_02290 [Mannheimia haemolytica]
MVAYRQAILLSLATSIVVTLILLRLAHSKTITIHTEIVKEVLIALLGLEGTIIGFLLTILSIFATSSNPIIDNLRRTIHYKNLIAISLIVCFSMLLHCLFSITVLTINMYTSPFYASLTLGLLCIPITLTIRLFYIYYLILSR